MHQKNLSVTLLFLKIYALALSIFSLYRLGLFIIEYERTGTASISEVLQAFIMGLRFDIVVSGYILILPFFLLSTCTLFANVNTLAKTIVFYYVFLMFSLSFLVCSADTPYFSQFFARLSYAAFAWFDTPDFVLEMIIQEPGYWAYSIPYILLNVFFFLLLKRLFKTGELRRNRMKLYYSIPLNVLLLGLILLGIRGRVDEKSPIRVGTAYFSDNSFLNQLGLNPNFTLIRSYLDSKKHKILVYMDDDLALKNLQSYLAINHPSPLHPLMREVRWPKDSTTKHNVVIVLMESMSAYYLKKHGNTEKLVPFLDSISEAGYYFENCYTAGIHTHNGIFSTLFSYPAIAHQHPMKESSMKRYHGIASTLKENDYATIYFTTHDGQFDNVEGFLRNNRFETVVSRKDYPSAEAKTTLGVPDDFMFQFSIPVLNELHRKGKPFLAVYMTASNHSPYYLPDYFLPESRDIKKQIVEYSDWSLKKFIDRSHAQSWFDNTIFVFVADHGVPRRNTYDIPLDYLHTPLLFFAPSIIREKRSFDKIAGQMDVFPTLMHLLGMDYDNTTMGIDLLAGSRPYTFFNLHEKYGVIDKEWLLILYGDGRTGLYKYKSNDKTNYADKNHIIAEQMKTYLISHLQAGQFLSAAPKW